MTRQVVPLTELIPQLPQTIFLLLPLLIASIVSACSHSPQKTTPDSSSTWTTMPASSSGSSEFEGTITAKITTSTQPIEYQHSVKGDSVHALISQNGGQEIVVLDSSSGTQTTMWPQTKTYVTLTWNKEDLKMSKLVIKLAPEIFIDPSGGYKATSTGKTEKIAGYTCEHWRIVFDEQDADFCLTKGLSGLGYFGGSGQYGEAFDEVGKAAINANPEFAKFIKGGVFPLKKVVIKNGQPQTRMEVTKIERKSLNDSLFTVPRGYRKVGGP